MAVIKQQQSPRWYQDKERVYTGLARSSWVTAATDWFMSFAGKAVELVLYATVLYSCAQLYPGVDLPARLSLAVFLVQMGALDIGGLAMGKLARQANEEGNTAGARHARHLSYGLIAIMLVSVATVGIERVIPVSTQVRIAVELVLVIARSVGSVLYGRVVHDLKPIDGQTQHAPDVLSLVEQQLSGQAVQFQAEMERRERALSEQFQAELTQKVNTLSEQFQMFTEHLHQTMSEHREQQKSAMETLFTEHLQKSEQAKSEHPQETPVNRARPAKQARSSAVHSSPVNTSSSNKKEAVHSYLIAHPDASVSDIVNTCHVSRGYASEQRTLVQSEHPQAGEIPAGKPALSLVRSPAS